MIPRNFTRRLCNRTAEQINMFPQKDSISDIYSPRTLMGEPPLDYNRDFKANAGAHVQIGYEATNYNTPAPRTLDGVFMDVAGDNKKGYAILDLNSGRETVRDGRMTVLPVTNVVINAVEKLAEKQGIKSLKIQNQNKTIFYPAEWIAGVDYDPETTDEEETDKNYNNNDNENDDEEQQNEDDASADSELDDEEQYDSISQEEIDSLNSDTDEVPNPVNDDNDDNDEVEQNDEPEQPEIDDEQPDPEVEEPDEEDAASTSESAEPTRRSTRTRQPREIYTDTWQNL